MTKKEEIRMLTDLVEQLLKQVDLQSKEITRLEDIVQNSVDVRKITAIYQGKDGKVITLWSRTPQYMMNGGL